MKQKQKPDAEEFARKLLWHLSGIRAEMRIMLHMFARHIEPDIKKADALYEKWIGQSVATQRKLYEEALETVGIPKAKD
jgi:hypothetical protein